jgi:hypothetical protein
MICLLQLMLAAPEHFRIGKDPDGSMSGGGDRRFGSVLVINHSVIAITVGAAFQG